MIWRVGRSRHDVRSLSISRGGWHLASLEETHGGLPATLPRCQISLPYFFFQFPRLEIVLKEGLPQGMYISSPPKKNILHPGKLTNAPLKRGRVFNRKHQPIHFCRGTSSFVFRGCVLDWSLREFLWGENSHNWKKSPQKNLLEKQQPTARWNPARNLSQPAENSDLFTPQNVVILREIPNQKCP